MDPEIPLSQPEEENSSARVDKALGAAFDPSAPLMRTRSHLQSLLLEGCAENRCHEFCGKYVFGVPLGEGTGVACFPCAAPEVPDPSLAVPSPSVGNWLTGWRSHAPRASDTVAISTKYFFIEFCHLSTLERQRKDSACGARKSLRIRELVHQVSDWCRSVLYPRSLRAVVK